MSSRGEGARLVPSARPLGAEIGLTAESYISPAKYTLTESTVLAMVAQKLQGMRVLSVGTTQTPSGQDIIIRLAKTAPETAQNARSGE